MTHYIIKINIMKLFCSEISLLVFDAFSVPRFTYVQDRKKFVMYVRQ